MKNLLICLAVIQFGSVIARPTVTFTIVNQTKDTVTAYIEISDGPGQNSNILWTEILLPKANKTFEKDVDKYSYLTGYGVFNKGGKSESTNRLITKGYDNFSVIISLPTNSVTQSLSDFATNSTKILEFDPSKFLDNDITPKPIEGLFNEHLGGLILFTDSVNKKMVKSIISPTDLKNKMKLTYGSATASQEINFRNQNAQDVRVSIPVIAQLGVSWDKTSFYNVKIEYSRIGVIDYVDPGRNLSDAFASLGKNDLYNIGYLKFQNPALQLRQINQAYVFEAVYLEVNQGTGLTGSNQVSVATFFTDKGNFSVSRTALSKKVYGNSYLGYWCSNTAKNLTGQLNFALAIYYNVTNSVLTVKTEDEVLKEYKNLKTINNSLPELKTKQEVLDYFDNFIKTFKQLNPERMSDPLLQKVTTNTGDDVSNMTQEELKINYENLIKDFPNLPKTFDEKSAKILMKVLQPKKEE